MANESELCPKCGHGHLRPTGESSTAGGNVDPFRQTGNMRILVCDNCGMKRANVLK